MVIKMRKLGKNLFYLFLPLVVGGVVALLISGKIDYGSLVKPPLAPPSWAFPVAWSIIYLLMGISFLIYKRKYQDYDVVDTVYYMQLFVNAMWSIIFFVWKLRFVAIVWIILLWLLVALLLWLFYNRKKVSCYLNIFYFLWVTFATYLTIGIYVLN